MHKSVEPLSFDPTFKLHIGFAFIIGVLACCLFRFVNDKLRFMFLQDYLKGTAQRLKTLCGNFIKGMSYYYVLKSFVVKKYTNDVKFGYFFVYYLPFM